jgi:predicted negative regulator of RcsB-dependent stress response
MDDWMLIGVLGCIAMVAYRFGYRWWRDRQAGKQADALLANILKRKDSFRR